MRDDHRRPPVPVRWKLLLLGGLPFAVSVLMLGLFAWVDSVSDLAYRRALRWQEHARVLDDIDWAAKFYVEEIGDRFLMPGHTRRDIEAERVAAAGLSLQQSKATSSVLARKFSAEERADERELDALIEKLLTQGDAVGIDTNRYAALKELYSSDVQPAIARRLSEEQAGAAKAIAVAEVMTTRVHNAVIAGCAMVLIALFTACWLVARAFARSVVYLQTQASRVACGDLGEDVRLDRRDELGQLAASLNTMVASLRRQRQAQLGFLAGVVHDLRNPLAAMKTATGGLLRTYPLPPEPALRRSLELIDRQSGRLSRMADDLFDAACIEAGELDIHLESCDARDLVREVGQLYAHASPRHTTEVSLPDDPVMVACDPARIAQVLNNLVSNAIKYSPAGGRVRVTLAREGDAGVIAIADEGVGIAPEDHEAIFEPFRRISPTKDVLPGVGLGLSTSRHIIAAHGGKIEVDSAPGAGSTFRVRLPLIPAS